MGRFVARFPEPGRLAACYEAGPTGYELYRLLVSLGLRWSLAEAASDGQPVVEFPYFERAEPTVWDDPGTYVDTKCHVHPQPDPRVEPWPMGEIITALLNAGMQLTGWEEHDCVPWAALAGHMDLLPNGEWRLRDRPWRLPQSYTLQAVKRR